MPASWVLRLRLRLGTDFGHELFHLLLERGEIPAVANQDRVIVGMSPQEVDRVFELLHFGGHLLQLGVHVEYVLELDLGSRQRLDIGLELLHDR